MKNLFVEQGEKKAETPAKLYNPLSALLIL